MDEREKIISIIRPIIKQQYLMRCKEPDGCDNCWIPCSVNERAKALADALIAANIGDVTEWKERAEKHRVIALPGGRIKQLYSDEEVEEIVRQRDEYKHRAEVAEKALKLVSECDELLDAFCELIGEDNCDFKCHTCLDNYFLQQAEREIAGEKGE